jgi:rhamnose utilization protein RhaD (predicted bifunctional aldolase and dehydrogenase)
MTSKQPVFQHVRYAWDGTVADKLDPVDRLVYRSNILGADQRITNTGGGNTSSKIIMSDPLTGEDVDVLWVKGSGGDLRTAKRANFSSLYMDKLRGLQQHYHHAPQRGPKSAIEDAIVDLYPHATFNLNPRPSSIDTPLHAFVPARHVDHMHPNAVIAIAVTAGIFVPPDTAGRIPDDKWALTFAINVTGLYLVADEVAKVWQAQGLPANLVLTTSVNAVVAKKGSLAYDTSKAAANHLVRELARFYAERTLLKRPITPADQAEAIFLLLTQRLRQTTGQILTVDGGLQEAFLA